MREMHYNTEKEFFNKWWPDGVASIQSFVRHTMSDIERGISPDKIHGRLQAVDIRLTRLIDFIYERLKRMEPELSDDGRRIMREIWLLLEPIETREERGEIFWPLKGVMHIVDDNDSDDGAPRLFDQPEPENDPTPRRRTRGGTGLSLKSLTEGGWG